VMSWGTNAEVMEPDYLREEIAQELQQCLKKYSVDLREAEQF